MIINKTISLTGGYTSTKAKISRFVTVLDSDQAVSQINANFAIYKDAAAVTAGESCGDRSEVITDLTGWSTSMTDAETLAWVESKIQD